MNTYLHKAVSIQPKTGYILLTFANVLAKIGNFSLTFWRASRDDLGRPPGIIPGQRSPGSSQAEGTAATARGTRSCARTTTTPRRTSRRTQVPLATHLVSYVLFACTLNRLKKTHPHPHTFTQSDKRRGAQGNPWPELLANPGTHPNAYGEKGAGLRTPIPTLLLLSLSYFHRP